MATKHVLTHVVIAVTAAAAGALVGILLAPASGQETRRRLARRIEEKEEALKRGARVTVDRAAAFASERIEAGKERLDALLEH